MFCMKCQEKIPDTSIFCPFCGKKQVISSVPKPRTRLPNRSGTVYKRGSTWTAYCRTYDGTEAARRFTKGGFKTKTAALDYCRSFHDAPPAAASLNTIDTLWNLLKKSQKWNAISKDKRGHYETAYCRLSELHDRDITTLRFFELQEAVETIEGAFYPKRDAKTVLQKIFDIAVLNEIVPPSKSDIVKRIELPSKPLTTQDARTPEEMQAILKDWEQGGHLISAYALIMAYTGIRTGELTTQDVGRINLDRRVMIGGIKTDAGRNREIPLADAILPVLRSVLPAARYGLSTFDDSSYYAEWAKMVERTGIRPLRPYCQRHTCITRLHEVVPAIDERVIGSIVGHATAGVDSAYTHISLPAKLDAVNKMRIV